VERRSRYGHPEIGWRCKPNTRYASIEDRLNARGRDALIGCDDAGIANVASWYLRLGAHTAERGEKKERDNRSAPSAGRCDTHA
jgi:hypothetical protein